VVSHPCEFSLQRNPARFYQVEDELSMMHHPDRQVVRFPEHAVTDRAGGHEKAGCCFTDQPPVLFDHLRRLLILPGNHHGSSAADAGIPVDVNIPDPRCVHDPAHSYHHRRGEMRHAPGKVGNVASRQCVLQAS